MSETITVAEQFDDLEQEHEASRLGMWVFLGTEVLFFGALFTGYLILRIHYGPAFAEGSRETDLVLGIIESTALLISSLTAVLGLHQIQIGGSRKIAVLFLAITIFLGLVFFGIHTLEYAHDYVRHHVIGVNFEYKSPYANQVELFYFMYYVMTGFHLLHLTLGIIVMSAITVKTWRGQFTPQYYTPLELTVLYWHFVDNVWIFLFPLLYLVSRT